MKNKYILLLVSLLSCLTSCKKYLDAKTDKQLVIATSISDAQALMDGYLTMNTTGFPLDGTFMSDDYTLPDSFYDKLTTLQQSVIIWDKNATNDPYYMVNTYRAILNCNVALETLAKINPNPSETVSYNLAKGSALFFRAFRHYLLMNIYCFQYDRQTAKDDLGIPYKKSSNINEKALRPSLQSNFDDVLSDLNAAAEILPTTVLYPTRPSKQAALGLLARVSLSMNDYSSALKYADQSLRIYGTLMDYNKIVIPSGTNTPFVRFNVEDVFHATNTPYYFSYPNNNINTDLYASYDANDLRKTAFFVKNPQGFYSFRGWYEQNTNQSMYSGIATDELYLIRAEGFARAGNVSSAIADLNSLLVNRWKQGTFVAFTAGTAQDALDLILVERRKELLMRNDLRWTDIKRLNKDPRYAKTLTRTIHGVTYTLPPNDLRYALLIPPAEIALSGMQQNPR